MVKQKYTHRTFQIADMTIPLNVAVSKIVKESFPLRISSQTKLPDNMMVLPDIKVRKYMSILASVYLTLESADVARCHNIMLIHFTLKFYTASWQSYNKLGKITIQI